MKNVVDNVRGNVGRNVVDNVWHNVENIVQSCIIINVYNRVSANNGLNNVKVTKPIEAQIKKAFELL